MGLFNKQPYEDPFLMSGPLTISDEIWETKIRSDNFIVKDGRILSPNEAGDISNKADAINEDSASYIFYDVFSSAISYGAIINKNNSLVIKNPQHYEIKASHVFVNGSAQSNQYDLMNTKTKTLLSHVSTPYSEILVNDEYLIEENDPNSHLSPINIIKSLIEQIDRTNH